MSSCGVGGVLEALNIALASVAGDDDDNVRLLLLSLVGAMKARVPLALVVDWCGSCELCSFASQHFVANTHAEPGADSGQSTLRDPIATGIFLGGEGVVGRPSSSQLVGC